MYKTANIEEGRPTVDVAMKRVTFEIKYAKRHGYIALKLIHGYGSSGVGGRIRTGTRKYLAKLKEDKEICDFEPGEEFEIFNKITQQILNKCPDASKDNDLNRHNSGVTVVLL